MPDKKKQTKPDANEPKTVGKDGGPKTMLPDSIAENAFSMAWDRIGK